MTNPADQHIADLIEDLVAKVRHCTFSSDAPKRQTYIDQIAQLRASMNPVIIQKKSKS
jgi:hypothetical protein